MKLQEKEFLPFASLQFYFFPHNFKVLSGNYFMRTFTAITISNLNQSKSSKIQIQKRLKSNQKL